MRLGKVYYDLSESVYRYKFNEFEFIFSSKFYIMKFEKELKNYIAENSNRFFDKYGVYLNCDEFLAFSLYKKIEKRGFLVLYNSNIINKDQAFKIDLSFS